ncbi:MAG: NAD(P)H-hydrate epimerase [Acidimicrobiia bacterium]
MTAATFLTETGLMVPAVDTDQMREIDRLATDELGPNLFQMMENAGRNLALTVIDRLGVDWSDRPITVLAGTGGNGGGGICAARHLANRGVDVTLVVSDPGRLGPVPVHQLAVFNATDGRVLDPGRLSDLEPGLVVDALIGYGLGGPPRGVVAEMIQWAADSTAPIVSLDVPSGIDSATGRVPGVHVAADVTLTLALPKTGLDVAAVGELWLADIGIPVGVYRRMGLDVAPTLFGAAYRTELTASISSSTDG